MSKGNKVLDMRENREKREWEPGVLRKKRGGRGKEGLNMKDKDKTEDRR